MNDHNHGHDHKAPNQLSETPVAVIAIISRLVTRIVDRLSGDRYEVPLLVATACSQALKQFGIESHVFYGDAAWVEILENHQAIWTGAWGGSQSFWVSTQYGEIIDLNVSVSHRKHAHDRPELKPLYSPPILWSREVPSFYRYKPEGVAEIELTDQKDMKLLHLVLTELKEKCTPEAAFAGEPEFPNEPILCPGRKVLDDNKQSFKLFERALGVVGLPTAPF